MFTKLKSAQLYVRNTEVPGENCYLVCDIIKTDRPIETEAVNIFTEDYFGLNLVETKCYGNKMAGKGLDNIATEPIWREFTSLPKNPFLF